MQHDSVRQTFIFITADIAVSLLYQFISYLLKKKNFRYRVSQKTLKFSDELDIVIVMN